MPAAVHFSASFLFLNKGQHLDFNPSGAKMGAVEAGARSPSAPGLRCSGEGGGCCCTCIAAQPTPFPHPGVLRASMYMQQPFGWLPETLCTLLPHRPASFSLVFVEVHNLAPWLWCGMETERNKQICRSIGLDQTPANYSLGRWVPSPL